MDRATALRKIQKCLALSKSSEPHEAARAMQQAQALMLQFEVEHPELQAIGVQSQWQKSRAMRKPPTYEVVLARVVAEAFGCDMIFDYQWHNSKLAGGYSFVGMGSKAEVAGYSFAVLARQLTAARTLYASTALKRYSKNKVAAADEFCFGWVLGVKHSVLPNPPGDDERLALNAYMQTQYPDMGKLATSRRELTDSRRSETHKLVGVIAGGQTKLHQGVGTDGRTAPALAQAV